MAKTTAKRGAQAPAIPQTMKAALMKGFGGPDMIALGEAAVPKLGLNDVLIRVAAAGVGIWDVALRRGDWGTEGAHPKILGSDGAGVVAAVGAKVKGFAAGDEVFAYEYLNPKGGFHAEYAAVDASKVHKVPSKLSLDQAGAIGTTAVTALTGVELLEIKDGQTVLIFGATGGVGTMAVQFAKFKGARVLATASSDEARTYLHSIGADAVYDARTEDVERALEAVSAEALDAVLACAGGEALEKALGSVKAGGRVAFPNGVEPEPRAREGVEPRAFDGVADPERLERLTRIIEEYPMFDARIAEAFPLERAAEAHARVERGGVLGKVILRIGERRPAAKRSGR